MRLSLGLVLAVCLAGLQFLAVFVVVSSSYVTSQRALLGHAQDILSDVAANTILHSRSFLDPAEAAANLATGLAENEIVASDDPQALEKLLFQQLQTAVQFSGLFYGDNAGNFVFVKREDDPNVFRSKLISQGQGERQTELIWRKNDFSVLEAKFDPEDTYDPRSRTWYQKADAMRTTIWTDPYIFFSSQKPGITVASPVFAAGGALKGVIGVDIEIEEISDFLADLKVGTGGKALILNKNGDVIAHPNSELIKTRDEDGSLRFNGIDEIDDPIARAAFAELKGNEFETVDEETSYFFSYEGRGYVSTVTPVMSEQLPWTIGVFAPEDDFIGAIKENRLLNIGIATGIAAITAFLGLFVAQFINRPVRALAERATRISQGEFPEDKTFPRGFLELEQANETMMEEAARRRKSEQQYSTMFDSASRGMAEISPETGKFLRVNARLIEIFGYSQDELLGEELQEITGVAHDRIFAAADGRETGASQFPFEMECLRKDGFSVWVRVNALVINDAHGRPYHSVVTFDDVTQSKIAEAQIRQLNNDLATNARVNTMGQMAAGLAHELNQPLTAITQNADAALMTAREAHEPDEEMIEILTEIDSQAHRSADIIRALRAFVRKDDAARETFCVSELIEQTSKLVAAEARDHGVELDVSRVEAINVRGSRVQIAQVLVNLLHNGIEAISETKTNVRRIAISTQPQGDQVRVTLADTGPGIDEKLNLFTQFQTTKASGMGLGLSICKTIIDAHGGEIWYERNEPTGSVFHFTLPAGD